MSSSRVCSVDSCNRLSHALCKCSQQDVCVHHLKQHSDLHNARLKHVTVQMEMLFHRLNALSPVQASFRTELDAWREEAHRTIDVYYEKKKRYFDEYLDREQNEHRTEFHRLRDHINQLIREQNTTREHVRSIDKSMESLRQSLDELHYSHLTLLPLVIDDQLVTIQHKTPPFKHVLPLSAPFRTIDLGANCQSLATNDNHLLLLQDSKLYLLDRQLIILQQTLWHLANICEMFWSKTLSQFILITPKAIFTLDENTMGIGQYVTTTSKDGQAWLCGTCSENTLFLSTNDSASSVSEYTLRPSIQFVKQYRSPVSCTEGDIIHGLSSNNRALALLIRNSLNRLRFDICSLTTLERYRSFLFDSLFGQSQFRCCSLNNHQWLVINPNNAQLFRISVDGKINERGHYKAPLVHAGQLSSDVIAILTDKGINLHQLF